MKYHFLHITLIVFFLFPLSEVKGQDTYSYNINTNNDLPDNHTYRIMVDRYGYLWVGTQKGVVKYNGYDFKIFNLSNGLHNEDVWELFEDVKGRIWLGSIANGIGYIKDNKYHKAILKDFSGTLYPVDFRQHGKNILFNSIYIGDAGQGAICLERNDTIFKYNIHESSFNKSNKKENLIQIIATKNDSIFFLYKDTLYRNKTPIDRLYDARNDMEIQKTGSIGTLSSSVSVRKNAGKYCLYYYTMTKQNYFNLLNLYTGDTQTIYLRDYGVNDSIEYIHDNLGNDFFIITQNYLLKFNDQAIFQNKIETRKIIPEPIENIGSKIKTVLDDPFWKRCIGTTTNGFWINSEIRNQFKKQKTDLSNFSFVGYKNDSTTYWWNKPANTFAEVTGSTNVRYHKYSFVDRLSKVINYKKDTLLILGGYNYLLPSNNSPLISKNNLGAQILDAVITDSNTAYIVSAYGFYRKKLNDTVQHELDYDRYYHLAHDPIRKKFWAYNESKIFVHSDKGNTVYLGDALKNLGVNRVQQIVIDNRYGNIFLKGYENVSIYDPEKNTYKHLYKDLNLNGSLISIRDGIFIVAGRFGVLFSKITGKNSVSKPVLRTNFKDINYKLVYDCIPFKNRVLLNTDKGVYEIDIPSDNELTHPPLISEYQYRFILNYTDAQRILHNGDTVFIDQADRKLQFDIINPTGNGRVKYLYRTYGSNAWHELNANEFTLPPSFSPDKYYTFSIKACDNVWRSSSMDITLYIKPKWWQTSKGRSAIWAGGFVLAAIFFAASILITRKLVIRANKKKNLQMELELKSIYAQINPHFIFNTLNSALLLVSKEKMDDAYTHISKFSRLLRSYIKSSRNKHISIADEVCNLEDYIELQQTRFRDKFTYTITVDEAIDQNQTMIPSLLLQPFVENAINHGILQKKEPGNLNIAFKKSGEKNELVCIVEDDGVGRMNSQIQSENNPKSGSYGDLLIKDLVSIFNKYEQMNIEIKYLDKQEPLSGTIVSIFIKNPRYGE